MNIEMALKSRSYILDLDHVKLSLGFFFTGLFNGEFFIPAFRIYLYFCQKHTPKSRKFNVLPNFTLRNGSLVVPWSAIYIKCAVFNVYICSAYSEQCAVCRGQCIEYGV